MCVHNGGQNNSGGAGSGAALEVSPPVTGLGFLSLLAACVCLHSQRYLFALRMGFWRENWRSSWKKGQIWKGGAPSPVLRPRWWGRGGVEEVKGEERGLSSCAESKGWACIPSI